MTSAMIEALIDGASPEQLRGLRQPTEYTAAYLRVQDASMSTGVVDEDVRKSLRFGTVPMLEPLPDEVVVAVTAGSRFGRQGGWAARHDLPYHIVGSDAAEVAVEIGKQLGAIVRRRAGRDPDVVFEYTGRATFRVSVVDTRGGVVVNCGSSTGYRHESDTWSFKAGRVAPTICEVFRLTETPGTDKR
ncbi:MAG: hypothetical protein JF597_41790 [Streptomyces sp.]|jgi:hypothetical protein|uniref:hypothetical protein n=1 Tax=Streptomyces sp. TaxID=1931 RepID=UPI0026015C9D|nr:hypothetical protein [Streptomyces sp.]MBW8799881.1 hypothetical protein [Streptomyces sp.]